MRHRRSTALHAALGMLDAASAAVLFVATSVARFGPDAWMTQWLRYSVDPLLAAVLYAFGWAAVLWIMGGYEVRSRWSTRRELVQIAKAGAVQGTAMLALLFLFKLPDVSRLFLLVLVPAQIVTTSVIRIVVRWLVVRSRARGSNRRFMLVVGADDAAKVFAASIRSHWDLGVDVIGHLETTAPDPGGPNQGGIIGTVDDIEAILHSRVVDEVALCLRADEWPLAEALARLCASEGKVVRIPIAGVASGMGTQRIEDLDGVSVVTIVQGPDRTIGLAIKRTMDLLGAVFASIVLSPVLAAAAILLVVLEGRPVLFAQTRVGRHGRLFRIYKFRTMVPDAEARYAEVASLSDTRGAAFKMTDDPRVTRLGRWLRRTSIDELPQLWNVLRGDMSLVGPRPAPPREVEGYDIWHRRRLSMKPGITGLWQVKARRDDDFDNRARLDLSYIDRWSIWLDLSIMLRTLPAMLQGR